MQTLVHSDICGIFIFNFIIIIVLFFLLFQTYRDSLQKLQLMTDGELEQIFGPVDKIIPLHEGKVN